MTTTCTACDGHSDAYLCPNCTRELADALEQLPGLVNDAATAVVRQTHVYRSSGRPREPDEDWRGSQYALNPTPAPSDMDASDLIHDVGNTLTTWARHLAETRGVPVGITTGRSLSGPACPTHQHDYRPEGCGHHPDTCKQLHPDHEHDMRVQGCGLTLDPSTGEPRCELLHCRHWTCRVIRHGERTGVAAALVRWFLSHSDAIRYDEAAGDMYRAIIETRDRLRRAVDRSPSPLWAGPCHAMVTEPSTEVRDGTVYVRTERRRCERDLYRWPGSKEITCDGYRGDEEGCGTIHSIPSREYWLLASAEDALLPLATWQEALPSMLPRLTWPNRSTWWRWVGSGRLVARSVDRHAVELFRGGDVIDLVRAEQRRIVGNQSKRDRRTA